MSEPIALLPAVERMKAVVRGIADEELTAPTPCADTSVGALLDHVMGLAWAFRAAAEKSTAETAPPPEPSADHLPDDWRERLEHRLDALAAAWQEPAAWQGTTAVGGVQLTGEQAGVTALNELVLHGWDLARATGQDFDCSPSEAEACHGMVANVPDDPEARAGLFGPVVAVGADTPLFHRVLGLSGRDPAWAPS